MDLEIPIAFTAAMSCVVSNRLLLNIRGFQNTGDNNGSVQPPTSERRNMHVRDRSSRIERGDVEVGKCSGGDLGIYELQTLRTVQTWPQSA